MWMKPCGLPELTRWNWEAKSPQGRVPKRPRESFPQPDTGERTTGKE